LTNKISLRDSIQIILILCLSFSCGQSERTSDSNPVLGEVTTQTGIPMIALAGGTFQMGIEAGVPDEVPVHEVTVGPFLMDKYEVTQERYESLMMSNPSHFKSSQNPVEQVRWSEAADYCNARSIQEGLQPCYDETTFECNFDAGGYRLPTEAEWEFAARAGGWSYFDFGEDPRPLARFGYFSENSNNRTHPVGSLRANRWGFYDLFGNVAEWCNDRYGKDYYSSSPKENPRGPEEGNTRVLRGGSWSSAWESCRGTARSYDDPGITDACFAKDTYGFRCVRSLSEAERNRFQSASQVNRE